MSDSALLSIQKCNVQSVRDLAETWPSKAVDVDTALEVQDAVRASRIWPDALEDVLDSLWWRIKEGRLDNIQESGERLLALVDQCLRVVELVGRRVQAFDRQGRSIRGSALLPNTEERLCSFRKKLEDTWPWITEEILAESRAEYERGEYQSVQEILDELHSSRP